MPETSEGYWRLAEQAQDKAKNATNPEIAENWRHLADAYRYVACCLEEQERAARGRDPKNED